MSTLYIVATPIGNLKDITLRALDVLKNVDVILAEDTRRTGKLLKHYDISAKMYSYYEQNEIKRIPKVIQLLKSGSDVALVTNAGLPGISDPGYRLIRESLKEKIEMFVIPGASALTTAAVLSGLPIDRFAFEGFLPRKKGRKARFSQLANEDRSIIIFESPERLLKTLKDCVNYIGNRPVAICRELTKMYEDVFRGTLEEAVTNFQQHKPRGEIVIVIGKDDPNVFFKFNECTPETANYANSR
ncbi:MAG: 16S rRNA (cytidine(1402)-2'-O)-methyltransferase [Candidatus Marinimicrobia bacterium]|nr:16S rRNA (cytidine(1402)-2'-O)-methyltransferase [Candidatus Neomarinimicrobiota bacterium]